MKKLNPLPILDKLLNLASTLNLPELDNIVIVCVQHVITTTTNLFEAVISLGIKPNNIFVLGKQYSTSTAAHKKMVKLGVNLQSLTALNKCGTYEAICQSDINQMWENVKDYVKNKHIKAIIVLDDGGRCLERIPNEIMNNFPIVGIEQTTAGLFNPKVLALSIPFIDVATSAAKKFLESKVISDEIIKSVDNYLIKNKEDKIYGVVGLGTIGKALVNRLTSLGLRVVVFDRLKDIKLKNIIRCESVAQLVELSDYVFGCTGRDITQNLDLSLLKKDKTFISCSSEDKEFFSLLTHTQNNFNLNPFSDLKYYTSCGAIVHILNGGFPINFNRRQEISHPNNIQLTRGLLLGALIQSIHHIMHNSKTTGRIMLSPEIQKTIAIALSNFNNFWNADVINSFSNIHWIISNSSGEYCSSSDIFLNNLSETIQFNHDQSIAFNSLQISKIKFMQLSMQL